MNKCAIAKEYKQIQIEKNILWEMYCGKEINLTNIETYPTNH